MNDKLNEINNSIKYVISEGKNVDRIKLMKLLFLAEYYDTETKNLNGVGKGLFQEDFVIYRYGVFNFQVYERLRKLIENGELKEDVYLSLNSHEKPSLNVEIKKRLDIMISLFNQKNGWELAEETENMIRITPENKKNYLGTRISDVLKQVPV